jgi:hypothetical protein
MQQSEFGGLVLLKKGIETQMQADTRECTQMG